MMHTKADVPFLSRWSRLKRSGAEPVPTTPAANVSGARAPLPDVNELQFNDDFSQFLCAEVEEGIKRQAMKKLFHSPIFNVMDGLDVYIDDYSIPDPLDTGMLENLAHAHDMLFGAETQIPAAATVSEPVGASPASTIASTAAGKVAP